MIRVLASDGIEKAGFEKLVALGFEVVEQFYEAEELKEQIKNFDVLVVRSATKVTQPIIDSAVAGGRLKLVIRAGVGVDNIDVAYATEKGIKVTNTPKASSISVAELTIAHMFAVSRFVNISNVAMRAGKWDKKNYEGVEIFGKTLGLIGFGRIAKEVAVRAEALGMNVIYTDVVGEDENLLYKYGSLDEVLATSDYLSLHIPYNKETGAVIGKENISKMKDGAYLLNCARGGVVDEAALLEALNSGKLAGAGVDVFEEEPTKNVELVNHPKVSVTPHIGASTVEAQTRIGEEVVSIIAKFFKK
ncbi:MAG: D-2-hydroxyacid dehydrogenase [Clostridiaceae bacterium]|nr:D-2-hydroxyacid dehydrogenase [Clostridiaceae bacterium]